MGFATVLAERRTFGGVKMGWDEVPLIISRDNPSTEYVLDPLGTSRTFSAIVNIPANIQYYLDSNPIGQIHQNTLNASQFFGPIEESHTIRVYAEKLNENAETVWHWYPIVPLPSEDSLISENECHPTPQPLNAYMVIKSRLYKKQTGELYVVVDYHCIGCGGCSQGSDMSLLGCDLSLKIQVWWDPVTIPYYIEENINVHNCSLNGWKSFIIPSIIPHVDVVAELNTICEVQVVGVSGFQYGNSSCTMRLINDG